MSAWAGRLARGFHPAHLQHELVALCQLMLWPNLHSRDPVPGKMCPRCPRQQMPTGHHRWALRFCAHSQLRETQDAQSLQVTAHPKTMEL